jgi:hypothetical protein
MNKALSDPWRAFLLQGGVNKGIFKAGLKGPSRKSPSGASEA